MAWIENRPGRAKPYRVIWRQADGKRRSRSFSRWQPARRYANNVDAGTYVDPALGRIRLGDFAAAWIDRAPIRPKTRRIYEGLARLYVALALGPAGRSPPRPWPW